MATWNPEVMRFSKRKIDEALENMERLNEDMLKKVYIFEASVQDEVVSHTKEMITNINIILRDIKEKAQEQLNKMEKAAEGIAALENKAEEKIGGLK